MLIENAASFVSLHRRSSKMADDVIKQTMVDLDKERDAREAQSKKLV